MGRLIGLMSKYPQFAIISLTPSNATINPWTPEGYTPTLADDIMEHFSVGGIRLCRKGVVRDWPMQDGRGYDALHARAIRKAGYRVGLAREFKYNHLGEGYSTVWT